MQLPRPPPTPPEVAEYRDGRAFCKQPQELAPERLQSLLTEVDAIAARRDRGEPLQSGQQRKLARELGLRAELFERRGLGESLPQPTPPAPP